MSMLSGEMILGFMLVCLLLELTPGPNMMFLVALTMASGRRAGMSFVAGVALGLFVVGVVAALGIAEIILSLPGLYVALQWLGIAYLLWLAFLTWRSDLETSPDRSNKLNHDIRFFRHGLIINLLNPKAALFYLSILPRFIAEESNIINQTLALTAVSVCIATAIHACIVWLAGSLRPVLRSPRQRNLLRKVMALLLAVVALWLAAQTKF